jgi:hypothetical protein
MQIMVELYHLQMYWGLIQIRLTYKNYLLRKIK